MSAEPDALFVNPSRMFTDGPAAKEQHRRYLASILTGSHESEGEEDATLDAAAYERFVDDVAQAVIRRLREQQT